MSDVKGYRAMSGRTGQDMLGPVYTPVGDDQFRRSLHIQHHALRRRPRTCFKPSAWIWFCAAQVPSGTNEQR